VLSPRRGGLGVGKTGYFVNGIVLESQNAGSFVYGTSGFTTRGSSLSSSGGTSSNYNGAFFNSNGIGAGDNGAQKNAALPSWRMALGGGGAEWNGADTFAIARVAPGASFTAPSLLFTIKNSGNVGIGTATPTATLDVNGNMHTTGTLFFGDGSPQSTAGITQVIPSAGLTTTVLANKLSVGLQTCTTGQVLQSSGATWACATPAAGSGRTHTPLFRLRQLVPPPALSLLLNQTRLS